MKTAIEEERVWITLIGAPDELLLESSAYQEEIRDFAKALRERGLRVSPEIRNIDAAAAGDSHAIYTGAFALAKDALALIVPLLLGWAVWPQGEFEDGEY